MYVHECLDLRTLPSLPLLVLVAGPFAGLQPEVYRLKE